MQKNSVNNKTGPVAEAPHLSASPSVATCPDESRGSVCWRKWGPRSASPVLLFSIALLFQMGCSGCREPESIPVRGQSLELEAQRQATPVQQPPTGPRVIEIRARPYTGEVPGSTGTGIPSTGVSRAGDAAVSIVSATPPAKIQPPPGAVEEEALTRRLTDRLKESKIPFNENNPPKIYVSNQTITEFSNYYESKGQKISRMSIPASVLIAPVLQEHPELSGKIDAKAMENVVINQIVVEGTGISAADKYIDPDTLQVVDKLFVTDMPADLGKKD